MWYKFKTFIYNHCKLYRKLSNRYIYKSFLLIDIILHVHTFFEFFRDCKIPFSQNDELSLCEMFKYRFIWLYNENLEDLKDVFQIIKKEFENN